MSDATNMRPRRGQADQPPERTDAAGEAGRFDLYCDLRRKCSSLKALSGPMRGRVVSKPLYVVLRDVSLRVGAEGRRRVERSGVRSVHAYARGERTVMDSAQVRAMPGAFRIRYNPHLADCFFDADTGREVRHVDLFAVEGSELLKGTWSPIVF